MEYLEEDDIKPLILTDDLPDDKSWFIAAQAQGVTKLKQSRYEDVWPEDVHAAFMEAVALYPPMGKRRLKYYRISADQNERFSDSNKAKSFGRCQLIQSYILEKTGKNRSRKQVSSHLQRLKKLHKDNPAARPLFSERSHPPEPGHCSGNQATAIPSQDIFANISFSTRHLKSDYDLTVNLQSTDTNTNNTTTFSYTSEAPSFNAGSCSENLNAIDLPTYLHNQPSCIFSQDFLASQQYSAGDSCDYLSQLQNQLLFKDAINGGSRAGSAFNTSAFSMSMRCLASRRRQVDLGPTAHRFRTIQPPGFQSTHQWVSHGGLPIDGSCDGSCNSPLNLSQDVFHTTAYPPHLTEPDKQRLDPGFSSDLTWPHHPDMSLEPRDGTFGEVRLRYPSATYQYDLTYPEMRDYPHGSYGSPTPSQVKESQLPRGIPYSYAFTTPVIVTGNVSKWDAIDSPGIAMPESPENLVSPLIFRPTPIYPISYTHSESDRPTVLGP